MITLRSQADIDGRTGRRSARRAAARATALVMAALCAALLAVAFAASAGALPPPAGPGMVLWAQTFGGSPAGFGQMSDVVADARGNAYFGGTVGTAGQAGDVLLTSYTPEGAKRWSYRWDGPAHGWDGGSQVSVVLSLKAGLLYAAFDTARSDGHDSLGVLCVTTSGKKQWARLWHPPSGLDVNRPSAVLDTSGNLGVAVGTYDDTGAGWVNKKAVVVKYTPKGRLVWAKSWSPAGEACGVTALAAGPGGRLCAVGTTSGGADSGDIATVMYSPNGKLAWTAVWDSAATGPADVADYARDTCFLPKGAVAVLGTTDGVGQTSDQDALLIRYSASGKNGLDPRQGRRTPGARDPLCPHDRCRRQPLCRRLGSRTRRRRRRLPDELLGAGRASLAPVGGPATRSPRSTSRRSPSRVANCTSAGSVH